MLPFSPCVPLLVPSVMLLVICFACPSLPLVCFHRIPIVMALCLLSPPATLLSSLRPIAPPIVSRNGETPSSCLPSCVAEGAGACGFSSCLVLVFSSCLVRCRSYLKTLLGNLLKTCLGKLLKTFTGNLLEMVKHIHLPICSVPPFCDCVAASPPIASLFSLVGNLS